MNEPLVLLIIGIIVTLIFVLLFYPNKGIISVWKKSSRGCNADNMLREETPEQFIIKHSLIQTHDQIRTMREIPNPEQLRDGQSRCL